MLTCWRFPRRWERARSGAADGAGIEGSCTRGRVSEQQRPPQRPADLTFSPHSPAQLAMALTDAQGWPQLHTRFASKEDLLLTCELASSRAGFSNLGVSATQTAGIVRCSVSSPVEAGRKKKFSCNLVLVVFKKVDGGKEVEVNEVHGERLKASAHGKAHKDLSVSLVSRHLSPHSRRKEGSLTSPVRHLYF